mmetsp:Transcript_82396/g.229549  ORF Transcript_82396/g.229549 Transcript_82396/m.229549 type:complete len:227 (+) Transcript_82396:503-1183(+)
MSSSSPRVSKSVCRKEPAAESILPKRCFSTRMRSKSEAPRSMSPLDVISFSIFTPNLRAAFTCCRTFTSNFSTYRASTASATPSGNGTGNWSATEAEPNDASRASPLCPRPSSTSKKRSLRRCTVTCMRSGAGKNSSSARAAVGGASRWKIHAARAPSTMEGPSLPKLMTTAPGRTFKSKPKRGDRANKVTTSLGLRPKASGEVSSRREICRLRAISAGGVSKSAV